jgi:hypothetical protein
MMHLTARRFAAPLLVLGGLLIGACYDIDLGCINIDGPCPGPPDLTPRIAITGFPPAQVDYKRSGPDGGAMGPVPIGGSVTLYAIRVPGGGAPVNVPDTVRTLRWGVSDSAVATISLRTNGGGVLTARAPGMVYVFVDGVPVTVWSCEGNGCTRVQIEVATP